MKSPGTDSALCAGLLKEGDPIEIETGNKMDSMSIIAGGWYLVLIIAQRTKKQQGRVFQRRILDKVDYGHLESLC